MAPLNLRLIYASMTGYGEHGPDAEPPGFDSTAFFARSGLLDALTYDGAISAPIRLSFVSVTAAPGPGPLHDQHADELLAELGYGTSEVLQLRQAGALS